MATDERDFGALLAVGLLGLGAGLVAAAAAKSSNESRRERFFAGLAAELAHGGLTLVSGTLGRRADGHAFWDITVEDTRGQLWTTRVDVPVGQDPYGPTAQSATIVPFLETVPAAS